MKKAYLIPAILIISIFILSFCSMTSFVFPIHNWVDQNCFLTVGIEMLGGKVPYRDLFEQKGPLLYFFHMIAAAIDNDGFFGVFLIQIPIWTTYLYILYKIAQLCLTPLQSFAAMGICGTLSAVSYCYSLGDNAEEFALPIVAFGLWTLLFAVKNRKPISFSKTFVNGIFAGALLMIKFTLLGFYIGWVIICAIYHFKIREGRKIYKHMLIFVSGMLLISAFFIVYFIYNNSLMDFINVYFRSNIFLYSSKDSLVQKIVFILKTLGTCTVKNPVLMFMIFLGQIIFIFRSRGDKLIGRLNAIIVTLGFWTSFLFIYIGGTSYRYYLLAVVPFSVFGIIAICEKIKVTRLTLSAIGILCLASTLIFSNCRHYYGMGKEDYVQFVFAEKISEGSMLLNYNFLDGGFYLASNAKLPPTKYFCKLNIDRCRLPEMYDEQEELIKKSVPDFVVTRISTGNYSKAVKSIEFQPLYDNYTLIDTFKDEYNEHIFYLYERK